MHPDPSSPAALSGSISATAVRAGRARHLGTGTSLPGHVQQPYPLQPTRSVRKERGLSTKSHTFHLMATIFTCGF